MNKPSFRQSLAFHLLSRLALLTAAVVMTAAWCSYIANYFSLERQSLDNLSRYSLERASKESLVFRLAALQDGYWQNVAGLDDTETTTPRWTGLEFDPDGDQWSLSALALADSDTNRDSKTFGLDLLLTEVINRSLTDRLDGAANMILLSDGRVLSHPAHMVTLSNASTAIGWVNDPDLVAQYEAIIEKLDETAGNSFSIDDEETESFIVGTRIEGPDWWLVTIYPEDLIEGPVARTAAIIFLIGGIGLAVQLYVLYRILGTSILRPLQRFADVSEYIANGRYDQQHAPLPKDRRDEVGMLARTFLSMEQQIHDYSAAMEEKVRARTAALEEARQEAERLARLDPMTGIANRRSFMEYSDMEISKLKRGHGDLCAVLLDIDRFKSINDTHGHAVGDMVIKALASILKDMVRSSDFCARIGGEEFVVLLTNTDTNTGKLFAEKLRSRIEAEAVDVDGQDLHFTASLGLAQFSSTHNNMDDLLSDADKALYQAKENGRNQVVIRQSGG